jgi:NAD-dependent SIR2 family protein deacetylase
MCETLNCIDCGEDYPRARYDIFKDTNPGAGKRCIDCATNVPPPVRIVATLHKSNDILITNPADLIGINNKGGLVR